MSTAEDSERLAAVGRALWNSVLGNVPPASKMLHSRMSRPRPGDLVMEVTKWGPFDPDSIGTLLRVGGDRFVVEPLHRPGEEQGWRNADFIALPPAGVSVYDWSGLSAAVQADQRPKRQDVHVPLSEIGNPDRPYYDPAHPHRYWVGPVEADDGGQ